MASVVLNLKEGQRNIVVGFAAALLWEWLMREWVGTAAQVWLSVGRAELSDITVTKGSIRFMQQ